MEINFGKAVNNTKIFQHRKKTTDYGIYTYQLSFLAVMDCGSVGWGVQYCIMYVVAHKAVCM